MVDLKNGKVYAPIGESDLPSLSGGVGQCIFNQKAPKVFGGTHYLSIDNSCRVIASLYRYSPKF